jgi:hypothetical protein
VIGKTSQEKCIHISSRRGIVVDRKPTAKCRATIPQVGNLIQIIRQIPEAVRTEEERSLQLGSTFTTYGETNGFTNALNLNNQSAALMAWTNSKIGLAPETSGILSTQTVGNSSYLTELAMIEASDTASPDCLNAGGSYRQTRNDAAASHASLQSATRALITELRPSHF